MINHLHLLCTNINNIQYHAARDLSAWKRLMWLESKHGPLPGTKAKVFLLTSKLDNVGINSYTIIKV